MLAHYRILRLCLVVVVTLLAASTAPLGSSPERLGSSPDKMQCSADQGCPDGYCLCDGICKSCPCPTTPLPAPKPKPIRPPVTAP